MGHQLVSLLGGAIETHLAVSLVLLAERYLSVQTINRA